MVAIDKLIEYHKKQSTGVLSLKQDTIQRACTFKKGAVVYVDSNQREETLGALLVKEGKITAEQHMEVMKKMVENRVLQGDVLISMGLLNPGEVFEALNRQMVEKLKNTIKMQGCEISFSTNINRNNPDFSIPFARTLLNGLIAHYTPERYKKEGHFNRDAIITLNSQGEANIAAIKLVAEELKSIRLIDGKTSFTNYLTKSSNKRLAAALVFFLDKMGYLDFAKPKTHSYDLNKLFDSAVEAIDYSDTPKDTEAEPATAAEETTPEGNETDNEMYSLLLKMKKMNYFEILNVPKECSKSHVERAYNMLCKQYHLGQIDKHYEGQTCEHAKQLLDNITFAYRTLINSKRREDYLKELDSNSETDAKDPDDKLKAEVEALKAEMYIRFSNLRSAFEHAQEAVRLAPKTADYHTMLGSIQMKIDLQKGEKPSKEAEEHLRKAIEENPQYYMAYLELGYYYKHLKKLDKAANFFNKALDANHKCRQAETELRLIEKRNEKSKGLFSSFRKKS